MVTLFSSFFFLKIASLAKTKDPLVKISLDNYATIFGVTPTGIVRYLRLVTPVDREKQMTYTFTVRHHFYLFLCSILCVEGVIQQEAPVGIKLTWHLLEKKRVFLGSEMKPSKGQDLIIYERSLLCPSSKA